MKLKRTISALLSVIFITTLMNFVIHAEEGNTVPIAPVNRGYGVMTANEDGTYTYTTDTGTAASFNMNTSKSYTVLADASAEKYVKVSAKITALAEANGNELAFNNGGIRTVATPLFSGTKQLDVLIDLSTGQPYIYIDGCLTPANKTLASGSVFSGLTIYISKASGTSLTYTLSNVTETVYSSSSTLRDIQRSIIPAKRTVEVAPTVYGGFSRTVNSDGTYTFSSVGNSSKYNSIKLGLPEKVLISPSEDDISIQYARLSATVDCVEYKDSMSTRMRHLTDSGDQSKIPTFKKGIKTIIDIIIDTKEDKLYYYENKIQKQVYNIKNDREMFIIYVDGLTQGVNGEAVLNISNVYADLYTENITINDVIFDMKTTPVKYSGSGIVVEAESYVIDNNKWSIIDDENASNGKAAKSLGNQAQTGNRAVELGFNFTVPASDTYNIWARIRALDTGSDSVFFSLDNSEYASMFFSWDSDYYWMRMAREDMEAGNHSVRFLSREPNFLIDEIIVTSRPTYLPNGICKEVPETGGEELVGKWDLPPVTPPANEHPRVFFTANDIDKIKQNMESEEEAYAVSVLNANIGKTVGASSVYNEAALALIESKAFYYAINKETASDIGEEAASSIELIANMKASGIDVARRYGRMINVLAEIYDWCYDLLDETEKKRIIEICTAFALEMEISWPPGQQGAIVGHGSEAQLLRDLMSFAIAVYDERPDIWNYVGGRFYEEYVPVREFMNKSHYNNQGTNYGFYRQQYTAYAWELITGMGAEEPYNGTDVQQSGFSQIYTRRPDGSFFKDGDIYMNTTPPFSYYSPELAGLLIEANMGDGNGYLRNEYYRRSISLSNGKLVQSFADASPVLYLIVNNPSVETKPLTELPLSRYFGSPSGIMTARTSWDDGTASDSVGVFMKIGGYQTNNHQHLDAGNFEVYYKGLLAAESGNYNTYGNDEHKMYTIKSIAHNTVLVDDPAEGSDAVGMGNINDGGQRSVLSHSEISTLDRFMTEDTQVAQVLSHEIDPSNTTEPEYSYLKGDLTKAYTSKVKDFKRSFMFLNLNDKEIPGALIVFDKVNSSDKTFKKRWLLHSTEVPQINGSTSVFNGSYGGEMHVKTLLPKADNLDVNVVGDEETGWGIVDRYAFSEELQSWVRTKALNYVKDNTDADNESNTYRFEISPKTASEQDYFLNVMLMGEDVNENVPLLETDKLYGANVKDRVVLFSKSGEKLNAVSFNCTGEGTYKYTVCDMEAGEYTVTVNGKAQTAIVTEDGGVLAFEGNSGSITAVLKGKDASVGESPENVLTKYDIEIVESVGSEAYIRHEGKFVYPYNAVKEQTSGFDVAVSAISDCIGWDVSKSDDVYRITYDGETKAIITPSSTEIQTNNGTYEAKVAPYEENGVLMMNTKDLYSVLDCKAVYSPYSRALYLSFDEEKEPQIYVNGFLSSNTLKININTRNIIDSSLYCGVYNNGELTSVIRAEKVNDTGYNAEAELENTENVSVKVFTWRSDIAPIVRAVTPVWVGNIKYLNRYDKAGYYGITFNARDGATVTKDGDICRITKTGMEYETSAAMVLSRKPYIGRDNYGRYAHYSTDVKIKAVSNSIESTQLRVRGSKGFKMFATPGGLGSEYRLDCIVDLIGKTVDLYIDGVLKGTQSLEDWVAESYQLVGFEHYIVGAQNYSGGIMELHDTCIMMYSGDVDINEVVNNLQYLCYQK